MSQLALEYRIEGLDELTRKLADRNGLVGRPLRTFFARAALTVEGRTKEFTPVDTGRLRASMTHSIDTQAVPLWAQVGTNVEYARVVEFGSTIPRRRPRYMLRRGMETSRPDIDRFLGEMGKEIEAVWKR